MNHKKFSVSLRRLAVATAFGGLSLVPVVAQACAYEPYIGSVCFMANYTPNGSGQCPQNYVVAAGQELPISSYNAVYAVIGTKYGGDGRTTFKVPDLRGRIPKGAGQGPGLINAVQVAQAGGAEGTVLQAANLPAHIHPATFTGGSVSGLSATVAIPAVGNTSATSDVPANTANLAKPNYQDPGLLTDVPVKAYSDAATTTTLKPFAAPVTGGSVGGTVTVGPNAQPSAAVPVLDPFLGLVACFAVQGIFPTSQ